MIKNLKIYNYIAYKLKINNIIFTIDLPMGRLYNKIKRQNDIM